MAKPALSHHDFETMLLPVRIGQAAQAALAAPLPTVGGVPTYPTAVVAPNHKGVIRGYGLELSHEPGSVFAPGTTWVTVTASTGTVTATGTFPVTVGTPAPGIDLAAYKFTDLDGAPVEVPDWAGQLPGPVTVPALTGPDLRCELERHVARGQNALNEVIQHWEAAIKLAIRPYARRIERLGSTFDSTDALQEGFAVVTYHLRRHASPDRHAATFSRVVRVNVANRIKDRVHRAAGTQSAETGELRTFLAARRLRGLTYATAEDLARDHAFEKEVNKLLGDRPTTAERDTATAAVQARIDAGEVLASRFGLKHYQMAMEAELTIAHLDAPVGGTDEGTMTLADTLADDTDPYAHLHDHSALDALFAARGLTALERRAVTSRYRLLDTGQTGQNSWEDVAAELGFTAAFAAAFNSPESGNTLMRRLVRGAEAKLLFNRDQFDEENRERAYLEATARRDKALAQRAANAAVRDRFLTKVAYDSRREHARLSQAWMDAAAADPDALLDPVPPSVVVFETVLVRHLAELSPTRAKLVDPRTPLAEVPALSVFVRNVLDGWAEQTQAGLAEQNESTLRRLEKALDRARVQHAGHNDDGAAKAAGAQMRRVGERALTKLLHPVASAHTGQLTVPRGYLDIPAQTTLSVPHTTATATPTGPALTWAKEDALLPATETLFDLDAPAPSHPRPARRRTAGPTTGRTTAHRTSARPALDEDTQLVLL